MGVWAEHVFNDSEYYYVLACMMLFGHHVPRSALLQISV